MCIRDSVYADPHPGLAAEQAALHEYEAGFEGAEGSQGAAR